jgi:hypothetical protein
MEDESHRCHDLSQALIERERKKNKKEERKKERKRVEEKEIKIWR